VLFREGDVVAAGQPLFHIDARTYEAAVSRATADVQLARVRESLTRDEAERARILASERAIADEEAQRRQAAHAEAQARLAAAEAALQTAQLDREFTVVRAPIAGRIGRALVTSGNMVSAGPAQAPLATLVATTPLHVHFDVAERAVVDQLAALRARHGGQVQVLDAEGRRVLARAPIDFADHSIEAGTGTLRLRARVDAPPPQLVPGGFARVQLTTGKAQPTLLVPDKAIGTDQASRYVLVVGTDGKVEYRAVHVGAQRGELRVVESGVKVGEQVIVAGLMRVRPGMTVQAQPAAAVAERAAQAATPSKG
jgi:multidrug efflux system membrane fusion protein